MYFRENVRATGGFNHNDPRLDRACCSFLGSKLEAGATLNAYTNLPQPTKDSWTDVNRELARLFCNEEEKQLFLNNPGAFRKGEKSFLEYRNELTRRVDLYQPELSRVPVEYQRQLVNRFIEGIEDTNLQRKLRFHCRRNMTLNFAYEYAVDYEATLVEERVKEVAAAASGHSVFAATAAGAVGHSASAAPAPYAVPAAAAPAAATPSPHMQILQRSHEPKVKANEIAIEQLRAANAQSDDSLAIFKKEVNDKFTRLDERFDKLENLILAGQSAPPRAAPAQAYARPTHPKLWRPHLKPQYAGNPLARQYPVAPGVTGGVGFVNNNLSGMNAGPTNANTASHMAAAVPDNSPAMTADNAIPADSGASAAFVPPSGPAYVAPAAPAYGAPSAPVAAGMSFPGTMGAAAPPTGHFTHAMADPGQNTFPTNEFWGEHLDYEPYPVGYANPQTGTYSYPQGF